MLDKVLYEQWKEAEEAHFEGWDFSYIKDRYIEESIPWDYIKLAKTLVSSSNALLDMDTGGGEVFSQLAPFPKHTVAVEGWKPNVEIARQRLAPLGVKVIEADSSQRLPFNNEEFDLIVNRHGAFKVAELHRILKKGGQFFSQQVAANNLYDLVAFFDGQLKWPQMSLAIQKAEFEKYEFIIKRAEEWSGKVTFLDVGALVYFLKAIPWIVDNFGVDTHLAYLKKLQAKLDNNEKLEFAYVRYLIWAEKN